MQLLTQVAADTILSRSSRRRSTRPQHSSVHFNPPILVLLRRDGELVLQGGRPDLLRFRRRVVAAYRTTCMLDVPLDSVQCVQLSTDGDG